jgi:hypothetical protein
MVVLNGGAELVMFALTSTCDDDEPSDGKDLPRARILFPTHDHSLTRPLAPGATCTYQSFLGRGSLQLRANTS